jgi:hypothetical protein
MRRSSSITIRLAGCALVALSLNASPAVAAENDGGWVPLKDESLVIDARSPLNFSRFNNAGAAGAKGRLAVTAAGRIAPGGTAEVLPLHCASLALSPATGGFPKGKEADLYAAQLRAHGYNVARFHYVEATLMTKRDRDFDFDPAELDAWFYFLAALKREGIYWVIDALSSENGALGGVEPHRWVQKYDLKRRIYTDEQAQNHWRELVKALLARKNPHTGMTVLADPALLGVITVNEGGINHLAAQRKGWQEQLRKPFNDWLKKRYGDDQVLRKSWGSLPDKESPARGTVELPPELRERTPRMLDFQRFVTQLEQDTARWMEDYLRQLGYKGLVTGLDSWPSRQADLARSRFDWVDMHGYHDENHGFAPGTAMTQTSALDNDGRYLRWLAASRQQGKAFSLTEYGQPFWNRFRYEASLMGPAMASLQGWDFICLHAEGAIDLSLRQKASRKTAIHPYGVGIDPVTLAGETLAALLRRRGDIAPAKSRVLINFSGAEFAGSPVDIIEDELSSMGWLTGVELNVSATPVPKSREQAVSFGAPASGPVERAANQLANVRQAKVGRNVDTLRKAAVIEARNESDASSGVFVSDTGQIKLSRKDGYFRIITPRTEAIARNVPTKSPLQLGELRVLSSSEPALVAASALDDQPLSSSRSILLVLASDAQNTGMEFADAGRKVLKKLGSMPPQVRKATASLSLRTSASGTFRLQALALNGDALGDVPVRQEGKQLDFVLDSSAGPGVFFLLRAD